MTTPSHRGVAIWAEGLVRRYGSGLAAVAALRGCSFTVAAGEFVAIMGPSGCGKSTLLHLVGGMDRPDEGDLWVLRTRLPALDERAAARFRRTQVGFLFQELNLLRNLDARTNVELAARLAGVRPAAARQRCDELFAKLGLAPAARRLPTSLSGGERQRVAIARALVNRPPLLLADEPTGSLDRATGQSVMQILADLHRGGQTILLVTHDAAVAAWADRVLIMADGLIVDSERPEPGMARERIAARLAARGL